jgi:hypothetical protein
MTVENRSYGWLQYKSASGSSSTKSTITLNKNLRHHSVFVKVCMQCVAIEVHRNRVRLELLQDLLTIHRTGGASHVDVSR